MEGIPIVVERGQLDKRSEVQPLESHNQPTLVRFFEVPIHAPSMPANRSTNRRILVLIEGSVGRLVMRIEKWGNVLAFQVSNVRTLEFEVAVILRATDL
jgi:hypothetical protein